jgi:D-glycero-alpha-D-manno-heptose-7-phosphate kinase
MRISYIGGGTDYPSYFESSPGGVIAAAINQYAYVYSNPLSNVALENFRFTYRATESVQDHKDFNHPVMAAALKHFEVRNRLNFGTFSDLPAGIGLGGSSAFTVALVKLLSIEKRDEARIANEAIYIERELLKEQGGHQDQYVSAYGNFRSYSFLGKEVQVSEPLLSFEALTYLESRQALFWVGKTRNSTPHAEFTATAIKNRPVLLEKTFEIYKSTYNLLKETDISSQEVFQIISESVKLGWELKKRFSTDLDPEVSKITNAAKSMGINSFKLCGAGGSGFVLVLAEPDQLTNLARKIHDFKVIYPKISTSGCEELLNL